ncbi:aldo/keto reductase [Massilia sp. erpn]|uniref:aldo/keto reductase n=1 Tax=Massilia sp. erpn TaxID=2738142 RepID=UPI002106BFEA|nr:aldo/keto reductase [Massilia sp. erpn]UTY59201.1 aldo/keto reductase [Massilia sp. erpn]
MRTLRLASGHSVPVLGQGTWNMGESAARKAEEVQALQLGLDLGMSLIDTAEMYADGGAEEVVAEAVAGRREQAYLVSKAYPHNATRTGLVQACERSLRRLRTDYLDLYLLHWRGDVPLEETLEAFAVLHKSGKIRAFGVSNFDRADMEEALALPEGSAMAANQVLYNVRRRGIEWNLLPWCREHNIAVMAYSPLESARSEQQHLFDHPLLQRLAIAHGATPAQIALAWVLRQDGVIAIPKAVTPAHVRANRAAHDLKLSPDELTALDQAFPPPRRATPLAML